MRIIGVTGNQQKILVRTTILNPHPALQVTSKPLEILLPAAVITQMGVSTTGLEYGMERRNGKWDWISKHMQLQLTHVNGAAFKLPSVQAL